MTLSTRRATVADTEAVSRLAIESFVAKFGHLYPPEDLRYYLHHAYSLDAIERSIADAASTTWLLFDKHALAGFALIGQASLPHEDVQPGDGEIKRLYLEPSITGRGLGSHLMSVVLDDLLQDGPRTLWLGVYSDNIDAQRFYVRHGFTRVGSYHFPVGDTRDLEYILRRPPSY